MDSYWLQFCDASTIAASAIAWVLWRLSLYRCIKVVDGDTIHVKAYPWETLFSRDKPTHHIVRLAGINTPERGQPGYSQATEALSKRIRNRLVRIEWQGRGKYGRHIGVVYKRGRNLNRYMLDRGYAVPY